MLESIVGGFDVYLLGQDTKTKEYLNILVKRNIRSGELAAAIPLDIIVVDTEDD